MCSVAGWMYRANYHLLTTSEHVCLLQAGRYNPRKNSKLMNDKERRAARKGLVVYFAVLIAASAFFEWKILQTGKSIDEVPLLVVALMFTPAVASVIARF